MAPRDSYSYAAAPSANIFEGEAPSDEKKELVIGDRAYDVTAFIRRHPGGKIIAYQVGTDATDAYKQFHVRSTKADKVLKSLPSRALHKGYTPRRAALVADFQAFTAQLEAEGMFKPSIRHVVYRLAEVIGMHAAGAALIYNGWVLAGIMMLGVVQGRCGWLMHEGGHYSLTGQIGIDRAIQVAVYGLGCGMSGAWWRNQHNKHHATPQKLKHDVDLDTLPLVAFHARCVARERRASSLPAVRPLAPSSRRVSLTSRASPCTSSLAEQGGCQGEEPADEVMALDAGQALRAAHDAARDPRLAALPAPAPRAPHQALRRARDDGDPVLGGGRDRRAQRRALHARLLPALRAARRDVHLLQLCRQPHPPRNRRAG